MHKPVSDCHARPAAAAAKLRPSSTLALLARELPLFLCAAGCLITASVAADSGGDSLAALTAASLDLDQSARALEDSVPAAGSNVEIFFGERTDGLLLRYVRAQVDDGRTLQYEYSNAEALALAHGGLQRLFTLALAPGNHRLRLEYTAREARGLPGDPRIRGRFDQKFETSAAGRWVEAELLGQGYIDKTPEMKLRTLSAAAAAALPPSAEDAARSAVFGGGGEDDPRLRLTRFLLAEGRPFSAASELLYLQARSTTPLPSSFTRHLASILGDLGQQSRAEALARTLPPSETALLSHSGESGPGALARYQTALQQATDGSADQALPTLDKFAQSTPADSTAWALRDQANLNLGYQQLRSGQGAAAIDSFGRVRGQGPFSARGLLGLGWAYLDSGAEVDGKAASAAAPNAAAHASTVSLRPSFIGDVERRQRRGALHTTQPSSAQLQALRRALVPWTELIGRNPMDPAVQEGLLAIAYALDHTGAFEDAQRFYLRSVKLQETTLQRLQAARMQVDDGRMLAAIARGAGNSDDSGWHWQLPDVPEDSHWWLTLNDDPRAPDNFYFEQLLAEPDFNATLNQYHQAQALIAAGDNHLQWLAQNGGDAAGLMQQLQALRPRLLAASAAVGEQLKTVALADLQQQKQQAEAYLVEGRFALARSNDWAPEVAKK
ncbi:MAG: hypothetical protein JWR16_3349 [Nevskia sp.]|nr:hypothetical protein [Nevskia sp.]